jgi:hypothetical protein
MPQITTTTTTILVQIIKAEMAKLEMVLLPMDDTLFPVDLLPKGPNATPSVTLFEG